jgi:hypothetical protein
MRKILSHLAAVLLLTGAAAIRAQVSDPNALIAPTPKPPAQNHKPTNMQDDSQQWLWEFTKPAPNGRADDLRLDERFQTLVQHSFKQQQAMWGSGTNSPSLANVIPLFLMKYGVVTAEHNRILTVDGCVPSFCPAHGMLWVDLGTAKPLMVFAAVNWTAEGHSTDEAKADYELWLFPNRILSADELPLSLTESISHWDARLAAAHRLVPHIAHALLIEPNGAPYALDPALTGANSIAPQPDTVTPRTDEN